MEDNNEDKNKKRYRVENMMKGTREVLKVLVEKARKRMKESPDKNGYKDL